MTKFAIGLAFVRPIVFCELFPYRLTMFSRLFPKKQALPPRPPAAVPAGVRLYVIGDIHGRLDLLTQLLSKIEQDMGDKAASSKLIFLGDYIDRGADSKGVVERLMQPLPGDGQPIFLMGNHEQYLLEFFETASRGTAWLTYGGTATLLSYAISCPPGNPTPERLSALQKNLRERFPASHRAFLAATLPSYSCGDYFFAHAGARPNIPLEQQDVKDLLWIRHEFLDWTGRFDKIVVHGHTIRDKPQRRPHRIGIDTGAYASGVLTALVLEGTTQRLLQTEAPPLNELLFEA